MPKAEVGSVKYLSNKLKSKGLQRLRWYCQVCERQMRDENAFKQHTLSEGHVRQMLVVGENSRKHIQDYTNAFQRDFLQLLRTSVSSGKFVNANHFYNQYIAHKEHIHQNATRWKSLTEFIKFLGREGICRVQEGDRGLEIAWIDNSPEELRRQDALRKKERQDKGDEEREQMMIAEQVERARRDAQGKGESMEEEDAEERSLLQREEGQKIKLSFGAKKEGKVEESERLAEQHRPAQEPVEKIEEFGDIGVTGTKEKAETALLSDVPTDSTQPEAKAPSADEKPKVSLSISSGGKLKNVFATSKKNALGGSKATPKVVQPRPMSEAERIMREEIERKRKRENMGLESNKKGKH